MEDSFDPHYQDPFGRWVREFVDYLLDQPDVQGDSIHFHDWAYEAAEDEENRKLSGAEAAKRELSLAQK